LRRVALLKLWTPILLSGLVVPSHVQGFSLHGFVEVASGLRVVEDSTQPKDLVLGEGRVQLEVSQEWEGGPRLFLKTDFLGDVAEEAVKVDLREGYVDYSPLPNLDLRVGRQIITWGTGDFLFINDVFPKDYISFFIGRQPQYLKLASDALKASLFIDALSVDLVAIPFFTDDAVLTGRRLSFFDGITNQIVGKDATFLLTEPTRTPANTEWAVRLLRQFGSYEVALYGFKGFFHSPLGVRDPVRHELFFPELAVYGGSVRGPGLGGITNLEFGYYDSLEDQAGGNPFVENSSMKYLVGYERQAWSDFTLGLQYFVEQMLHFDRFKGSQPPGAPSRDEFRHLLTLRLTQLLRYQTVELSLFVFFSPSDQDYYLRPTVAYKITDQLTAVLGANVFGGAKRNTAFGQLEANDNVYLRLTYGF
jgi:hypothetical protein